MVIDQTLYVRKLMNDYTVNDDGVLYYNNRTTTNHKEILDMYYHEYYNYEKPYYNKSNIECGENFESFFKLSNKKRSRLNEDKIIYNTFFQDLKSGTYLELGAFDGNVESNTRFFDECLGWKGLLIEGNPKKFDLLIKNRPKAHKMSFAPSCNKSDTVTFSTSTYTNAGLKGFAKSYDKVDHLHVDVPCGPLAPVLEHIFEKEIHFFSLDVEGAELLVLDTIDFDKVQIDIMMIEVVNNHCPRNSPCTVRDQVRAKMKALNYTKYSGLVDASDVYVHPNSPFQIKNSNTKRKKVVINKKNGVSFKNYMNDNYNYQKPTNGDNIECGDSPDFVQFFSLNRKSRSRLGEDEAIYNTFFKDSTKPGTYIEVGAYDGKEESNTRFFDECLGWKGLLIEGNPKKYNALIKNRPKAHKISFAPSCNETGSTVTFSTAVFTNAGLKGFAKAYDENDNLQVDVPCGPLTPVLEAVFGDEKHVNFFSLDVEGAEKLVLDTIDFDKVQIDIMMIEVVNSHCPKHQPCQVRDQVRAKMKALNYTKYSGLVDASDVYVHPKSPYQINDDTSNINNDNADGLLKPEESEVTSEKYFYKTYSYQKPSNNNITVECGQSPEYKSFFNLTSRERSRYEEDKIIYNTFFQNSKPGTYVELGAFDGKVESNTRFFDECLGWQGLLIEGNPRKFKNLLHNRPKAHKISFAPSCNVTGGTVIFSQSVFTNAGMKGFAKAYDKKEILHVNVPCGPLSPVLENVFQEENINFFSLDVEGAEMLVLDTIDFNKVQIDVMMIEVGNTHCRKNKPCEVRDKVRAKMKELGYKQYKNIVSASDVYVHPNSPFQMKEEVVTDGSTGDDAV